MRNLVKAFARSEDGAITVDWVVLTAAIIGLQVIIMVATMQESLVGVSERIAEKMLEPGDTPGH